MHVFTLVLMLHCQPLHTTWCSYRKHVAQILIHLCPPECFRDSSRLLLNVVLLYYDCSVVLIFSCGLAFVLFQLWQYKQCSSEHPSTLLYAYT